MPYYTYSHHSKSKLFNWSSVFTYLLENIKDPLFGRENEIEDLQNIISKNEKRITYITGQGGVGKSALLEELYSMLQKREEDLLVGFYSRHAI